MSFKTAWLCALARRSWTAYGMMNADVPVQVGAERIIVPLLHGVGLKHLTFSEEELSFIGLIGRLCSLRSGAVVDVGANTGRFLMCVAAAKASNPYIGFEPSVSGCAYIERLIQANQLANHIVLPIALSDRDGVVRFSFNSRTDVCGTTTAGFYGSSFFKHSRTVPSLTGDTVLSSLDAGPLSLIKIDVEGGELEVLTGLSRTIVERRPNVIVEIIPPHAAQADQPTVDLRRGRIARLGALLDGWGYQPYRIGQGSRLEDRAGRLDPGASTDTAHMDYLCVPAEAVSALGDLIRPAAAAGASIPG